MNGLQVEGEQSLKGRKRAELKSASDARELKKELCSLIFGHTSLEHQLIAMNRNQICAKCSSGGYVSKQIREQKILNCKTCGGHKLKPCQHLNDLDEELFAYDLCAPDKTVDQFSFTTPIGGNRTKRNMDIFTAQQVAMKRAKALYERLTDRAVRKKIREFREDVGTLYTNQKLTFADDYDDIRRIKLIMIGASVTSVTFHATLADLMSRGPDDLKFNDVFVIKFVDVYGRPLERLMQARDRTVVPRYEYERLLSTPLDESQKSNDGWYVANPTYLQKNSPEARKAWKKSHPDMPLELRWGPGNVREVAKQIAEGHKKWMARKGPRSNIVHRKTPYDSITQFLGHWFVGIELPKRTGKYRGQENDIRFFSLSINKYGNTPGGQSQGDIADRPRAECCGDVLFQATGLGVDIAGDRATKIEKRFPELCTREEGHDFDDVYDFPSEQRSYWDPIKPELDIQEEKSKHILVVGNSDAAAGAVFSTLLTHFDSCTFEVLADMFWRCDDEDGEFTELQRWFKALQAEVNRLRNEDPAYANLSITDAWTMALQSDSVYPILIRTDYLRNGDVIKNHIRSGRSLYLGIRAEKPSMKSAQSHKDIMNELHQKFGSEVTSVQRYAVAKYLEDAWPENRILAFILRLYVNLLILDYDRDRSEPLEINRRSGRKKKTYQIKGHLLEYGFGGAVARDEKRQAEELKYVMNCGGRPYFQQSGNATSPFPRILKQSAA